MQMLLLAVFGLVGVFLRYGVGLVTLKWFGEGFPIGTLLVNISGAFLVGIVYTLSIAKFPLGEPMRIALLVGLLGGYTTFSAYCLQTINLMVDAKYFQAIGYVMASNLLGLAATYCGIQLVR
jgi:fluoride exporter